jgi:hypothetical protein
VSWLLQVTTKITLQAHCESNPAEDHDAWAWVTCSADCSALLSDIYYSLDARPSFLWIVVDLIVRTWSNPNAAKGLKKRDVLCTLGTVSCAQPPLSPSLFLSHTGGKSGTGGLLRPQTCWQLRLLTPTPPLHIKMNPERHVLLTPQEIYRVNLLDCLKTFVGDINLEDGELPSTPGVACEIVEDATRFGLPDC